MKTKPQLIYFGCLLSFFIAIGFFRDFHIGTHGFSCAMIGAVFGMHLRNYIRERVRGESQNVP